MKENKSAKIAKEVLSKMDDTNRISFLKTQTKKLCNMTYTFIRQLRDMWKSDGKEVPESDCIAQCMLQKGLMRTRTLLQLAEGQNLIEKSQVFIQDIPSMLSVLRSYYELCFTILSTYLLLATILYDFCRYSNDAFKIINSIDKDLLAELTVVLSVDQK